MINRVGLHFTTNDLCKKFGVSERVIRYWKKETGICPDFPGGNGLRDEYSLKAALRMTVLFVLIDKGFSVKAAGELVNKHTDDIESGKDFDVVIPIDLELITKAIERR